MLCTAPLGLYSALPLQCCGLWGTVFSTAPLGCVLHCPSGAVLCTSPLGLYSAFSLWGCAQHCLFKAVLCASPLGCALHCHFGDVICPSGAQCYALNILGTVLLGTVLCTAPLGLCYALLLWDCTLHCPSRAVPSGALCSAQPLWAVFYTAPLGLCSALPLWGYALHCPSGAVLNTASFRLWSVFSLWDVLCTATLGLCSAPQVHCALP